MQKLKFLDERIICSIKVYYIIYLIIIGLIINLILDETTQFHSLTKHTQCGKYIVHDTLTHRQSLRNCYELKGHHAYRLSPAQVAPGHVSEILAIGMERVKSENPELRRYIR